jgi:formamidopyrimidine-DNA glycosylase
MPELPEVEVVRRGLERFVAGRTLARPTVLHARAARRHLEGPHDLVARLEGATIVSVRRRGKYLWLPLSTGEALVAHLGMSGQLLVEPADAPDEKHLRIRLPFRDGGRELRFVDQRTFGGLHVDELVEVASAVPADAPVPDTVPASVAHIARDLLDPNLDLDAVVDHIRRRRSGIKRSLLDQAVVSGIGNIYADEALWRARVHYAAAADGLARPRVLELLGHAREVMSAALAQGGTSFDALYVDVNGSSGYFDRSLDAYGREGQPCHRCGRPIVREAFMNRSSFRCPRCQRTPRRAAW